MSRDSALHCTAACSDVAHYVRRPSLEQGLQQAEGHVRLFALDSVEAVRKALLPQAPVPAQPRTPHAVRAMPSSYRYAQISSQKCLVGEPLRYRGQEL